jgi:uncharacterized glyoxalase superfamily protein PhnB
MSFELKSLTPNLVVADVGRSVVFYRDKLGFTVVTTVPEQAPYVFALLQAGGAQVMLNAPEAATAEYPMFANRPIGGTLTLFFMVADVRAAWEALRGTVKVTMPLEVKWYGLTEFAFEDPDGYVVTFAEREAPEPTE